VLNNTSKVLVLSGLLINTLIEWWLGYEWLDLIGYSLIFGGLLFSKKSIIEGIGNNGIYIYYSLLVLYTFLVFIRWFL